jgi:tRNA-specific 2-thiouridylase
MSEKVFVGLSGGVDSSVTAALLKEQGYKVTGVYMKNWTQDIANIRCPWEKDYESARSVASNLNIDLKVYDLERAYKDKVVNYMTETYKKGLTPNPDIMCNQEIKFKVFLDKCLEDGAQKIATGHYARTKDGKLKRAIDEDKDQTYFLYRICKKAIQKTLFPVGDYKKTEVRKLAKEFGLPTYDRPDSQGLCFVGKVPIRDFLGQYIKFKPGDIVDEENKVVGKHQGAFFYTIGQRHGLGVGGGKPYFVYKTDVKKNIVYVTTDEKSDLLNSDEFTITDCVWAKQPLLNKDYMIKVRYRSKAKSGKILRKKDGQYQIKLAKKERAITPGQSAVFYEGSLVVGGGVII